ncbi:MAG: CAP domain-containing protein [Cyanobacteriota bacterium]|nr:CAP domain-containing protein [Cyanobacteriota bacterium]
MNHNRFPSTGFWLSPLLSLMLVVGCASAPPTSSTFDNPDVTNAETAPLPAPVTPSQEAPTQAESSQLWRRPFPRPSRRPTPNPTSQPSPSPTSNPNNTFAQEVVNLTNQERQKAGLAPLTVQSSLTQAAQSHAQDMALKDYFSHTGKDGSSPATRAQRAGYPSGYVGENIAAGYTTPQAVVQGWMNSSGHRANILNPNYKHIGVGYYYLANDTGSVNYTHYWVQVFGAP